jgi:hypothetical protein
MTALERKIFTAGLIATYATDTGKNKMLANTLAWLFECVDEYRKGLDKEGQEVLINDITDTVMLENLAE